MLTQGRITGLLRCSSVAHGGVLLASLLLLLRLVFGFAAPGAAQDAATASPPAKVQQLIELLNDPDVRQWLETKQLAPAPAAVKPPGGFAWQWVAEIRKHLSGLVNAIPRVLPEWRAARERIADGMRGHGTIPILRGFAIVLFVGYATEFLLRHLLRRSVTRHGRRSPAAVSRPYLHVAPLAAFAVAA